MSKYITLNDGNDFRRIAKKLTKLGHKMNHATARNVLMTALKSFFEKIALEFGIEITEEKIDKMLKSQQLHDALPDILFKAWEREMVNAKR